MKRARINRLLLEWYAGHGRTHLPWRRTRDPYLVLVSEFMLQQTQVERVLPKYEAFVARFPDLGSLASASTADVVRAWKGLGYNSRAVRLKQIAGAVVERFGGRIPRDEPALQELPGIGTYTARAIMAFAFELRAAAVDTNLRRVLHRVLYGVEHPPRASDAELEALASDFVPSAQSHDWNSALMDLGAAICTARAPKCLICPLSQVCAAYPIDGAALERARSSNGRGRPRQPPFEQTTRFARGRIVDRLRELAPGARISLLDLHRDLGPSTGRGADEIRRIAGELQRDGVVEIHGDMVALGE
ncbi:MAG TPA: A/G-specific adenine glycosylase [Candidatus Baltobacteraceae bacterium]|nr:A/G-specific adenine glycosylase [Candidatus Baltobacteraceae bacterium]